MAPVTGSTTAVPFTGCVVIITVVGSRASSTSLSFKRTSIMISVSSTVVTVSFAASGTSLTGKTFISLVIELLKKAASLTVYVTVRVSGDGVVVLVFLYLTLRNAARKLATVVLPVSVIVPVVASNDPLIAAVFAKERTSSVLM